MKNSFFTLTGLLAAFTVFVLLYPEYALLPDTCYYIEDGQKKECADTEQAFWDILKDDAGQVTVRFRLADTLCELFNTEGKQTCQKEKQPKQTDNCMMIEKKRQSEYLIPESED